MKRKRWMIILSTVLCSLLIIDVVASFYFYNLAIKRGPKDFLQGNSDLEVSAEALDEFLEGDWIDWTQQQSFDQLEMTSFDGLKLQGYYLPSKEPSNKIVVFAHGYLGNAYDMGLFGEYYYENLGYNVFTPDLRGHGNSEGDYIGFGWHDRLDLIDWINLLIENNGPDTEVVMHGLSMGAATVLMASGENLPQNVKAIIADSPYTSVYDLFAYQMERMFHLPDKPILPSTSLVTKQKAGYSLTEASAINQVKKATVPILYISGDSDTFVPTEMTTELYENTKSERSLVSYAGANHGESIILYRDDYLKTITEFIEKYVQ
ncbi:alpha/beta hydrolase [Pseudogracilibacillus sp. SE30717A]|uniref:alpha/beta hydrolase n=1 Tax=Pseudogracilibacillus sp. SE30717A TaxID=3098293 RepID=UPI00300DE0BA